MCKTGHNIPSPSETENAFRFNIRVMLKYRKKYCNNCCYIAWEKEENYIAEKIEFQKYEMIWSRATRVFGTLSRKCLPFSWNKIGTVWLYFHEILFEKNNGLVWYESNKCMLFHEIKLDLLRKNVFSNELNIL